MIVNCSGWPEGDSLSELTATGWAPAVAGCRQQLAEPYRKYNGHVHLAAGVVQLPFGNAEMSMTLVDFGNPP